MIESTITRPGLSLDFNAYKNIRDTLMYKDVCPKNKEFFESIIEDLWRIVENESIYSILLLCLFLRIRKLSRSLIRLF